MRAPFSIERALYVIRAARANVVSAHERYHTSDVMGVVVNNLSAAETALLGEMHAPHVLRIVAVAAKAAAEHLDAGRVYEERPEQERAELEACVHREIAALLVDYVLARTREVKGD